jgi:hypothetical protein
MIFMKNKPALLLLTLVWIGCGEKPQQKPQTDNQDYPPLDRSIVPKPPMGWNSYDCLGLAANEAEVKAAAEYMAKNLKHLGYEYVVIDMGWYGDAAATDYDAFVRETIPVKPNYNVDEYGRLWPDMVKYPSAVNGFYGVDMTRPGAQEYYNSVFDLFAEWGLDFVKADDMNDADIIGMSRALRQCGGQVPGLFPPVGIKKAHTY